jgi:hypothetical protein
VATTHVSVEIPSDVTVLKVVPANGAPFDVTSKARASVPSPGRKAIAPLTDPRNRRQFRQFEGSFVRGRTATFRRSANTCDRVLHTPLIFPAHGDNFRDSKDEIGMPVTCAPTYT